MVKVRDGSQKEMKGDTETWHVCTTLACLGSYNVPYTSFLFSSWVVDTDIVSVEEV